MIYHVLLFFGLWVFFPKWLGPQNRIESIQKLIIAIMSSFTSIPILDLSLARTSEDAKSTFLASLRHALIEVGDCTVLEPTISVNKLIMRCQISGWISLHQKFWH